MLGEPLRPTPGAAINLEQWRFKLRPRFTSAAAAPLDLDRGARQVVQLPHAGAFVMYLARSGLYIHVG